MRVTDSDFYVRTEIARDEQAQKNAEMKTKGNVIHWI